ncbi:MAG: hypothetical protein AB9842_11480 [Bacteroidales bacterium]
MPAVFPSSAKIADIHLPGVFLNGEFFCVNQLAVGVVWTVHVVFN